MRSRVAIILAVLALAACERRPPSPLSVPRQAPATAPAMVSMASRRAEAAPPQDGAQAQASGPMLAYSHQLSMQVPAAWVERHYMAALERCVAPACVVLSSQIDRSPGGLNPPSASIRARLTHDALPPFRTAAATALQGEPGDRVAVETQSTEAEDLTTAIADGDRRLQQLRDYRGRLDTLAARSDIQVSDLIKIAQTLSQTQSQIEAAEALQRGLSQRVDTEILTVRFEGATPELGSWSRVHAVWAGAGSILSGAVADALGLVLYIVPWVPVLVLLAGLVWFVLRLGRRSWRGY